MTALAEEVSSGVYRVADGIVNWYLVDDGGEVALYDAGWPQSWPAIETALAAIGRSPGDLSTVMLTHAHPDHLGAAERVRQMCSARVRVHAPEADRARGEAPGSSPFSLVPGLLPTLWRPTAVAFVLQAAARGFLFPTWLTHIETFTADRPLDVPGHPRPVATPGHTDGHVSFLLEDRGVAITGDALATLDVLTRARGPQLMPDALNADPVGARRALDALASMRADTLLPGHGDPFRGSAAEAVAQARERDEAAAR